MNIYTSTDENGNLNKISYVKNGIFLAGPCPRKDYEKQDKWRNEAYSILKDIGFDGDVFNPTNKYYDKLNKDRLEKQTKWENEAMHKASAIVFYLGRDDTHPGFTSNVEIGMWLNKPEGIFVCIPKDSESKNANRYIRIKCEKAGIPVFDTLEKTLLAVDEDFNRKPKTWFTADTHFGQKRTLELSKRPFKTVEDMNLGIISNWNKRIRKNDIVYHLGDFGDSFKYLNYLNYGIFNFIKGNYERDKIPEIMEQLDKFDNVNIYDNDECTVTSDKFNYILRHEPITGKKIPKNTYALFGHVHGRSGAVKENGIEVGIDYYRYCPASQEDIDFYANCLDKGYYDENVFTKICK